MKLKQYFSPKSIDEAYEILMKNSGNIILGGGCFLGISRKKRNVGIDLSNLDLKYILDDGNKVRIGSENTLREVSLNESVKNISNGILSEAIKQLGAGIQLKNTATIGGSVYSKYGFSDLIPSLLVLDAELRLYKKGIISVREYMEMKPFKDILVEIIINKNNCKGIYLSRRLNAVDIPQLNLAIIHDDDFKIAIGARPRKAIRADFLSKYIAGNKEVEMEDIVELELGNNIKASKNMRFRLLKDMLYEARNAIGENYDR